MNKPSERAPVVMLGIWVLATLALWGLAFAPTGGPTPDWLAAARTACFGTLTNGLPDTGGWIILVVAPLSFLFALVIVWGSELKLGLRSLTAGWRGRAILVIALSTAFWEGSWVTVRIREGLQLANADFGAPESGELPADYPRTDKVAPQFELIDQSGARFALKDQAGKTVLLTFAFAHCQTVCPSIVEQSKSALERLGDANVRLVIVTLDPWRDTPRSLPFLASRWELPKNAHVLSAEVPEVLRVLDLYQVPWKRDEKNGDIAHPALTYIIGPDGRIAYTFNNAPISWLVESARRLTSRLVWNR